MGLDANQTPRASGLKTALDTIIAPNEAFQQLRVAPTWGWAFLLTLVLYAIASYLLTPALMHATTADWPRQVAANPRLAALSPDETKKYLDFTLKIVSFSWLFAVIVTPITIFIHTIVMLIFKAIGRGDAGFGALWAAACNIALPILALNSLVTALIVMVRGPDSFGTQGEIQTAMPSLALLVPATAVKLHAFLAFFNPFILWGVWLTATAMSVVARVGRGVAWATGIVWLLVTASIVAMLAR